MNTIPQPIKAKLAQLAVFSERHTLQELANELHKLSLDCAHQSGGDFKYVVFYQKKWVLGSQPTV